MQVVRKLHIQANLCEVFPEDKQQHCCGDLVLGWEVVQNFFLRFLKGCRGGA